LAYISAAESIGVSQPLTKSVPKTTEFGEITQRLGLLRRSRSFNVTDATNRKLIYATSYSLIVTYLISCTVSKIYPSIGPKSLFAVKHKETLHFITDHNFG